MATGFPYKGNRVIPRLQTLDSGMIAACFTIESNDGAVVRYAREMPTNEFASEDDAIAYILDFSGDWIDQNPI